RFGAIVRSRRTFLGGAPTTSAPSCASGLHSTAWQLAAVRQARSAQSIRPLPSSSTPFAHCSGELMLPVVSVSFTPPCVFGYDWTTIQYVPGGSAAKVCVAVGLSPTLTHLTGLRSQAWFAPARKSSTA